MGDSQASRLSVSPEGLFYHYVALFNCKGQLFSLGGTLLTLKLTDDPVRLMSRR